jgi:hypothetical protein
MSKKLTVIDLGFYTSPTIYSEGEFKPKKGIKERYSKHVKPKQ